MKVATKVLNCILLILYCHRQLRLTFQSRIIVTATAERCFSSLRRPTLEKPTIGIQIQSQDLSDSHIIYS